MKNLVIIFLFISFNCFAWVLPAGEFAFEKVAANVYVMHGLLGEPSKDNHGFMNNPAIQA